MLPQHISGGAFKAKQIDILVYFEPAQSLLIGGDVGGIRHQIVHGQCGFLAGDVEQAAANIKALLLDPALRRSIGRRARERVRRHFLLTRLLEDWLALIAELSLRVKVSEMERAAAV